MPEPRELIEYLVTTTQCRNIIYSCLAPYTEEDCLRRVRYSGHTPVSIIRYVEVKGR